jgi:heat-inducible transcriptional repressor
LENLDTRKRRILEAIVEDYVATAEPIGSEWLVTRHDFGCKSATLRNEMAEMSDLGYLVQPHTSAGRIPSNRGYRFYVDKLMPSEAESLAQPVSSRGARQMEVEEIVQLTCRALSEMTEYPSVATSPVGDAARLHRLYLASASARHALLVLLLSTGHVENVLIEVGQTPPDSALQRVTNYLNEVVAGKSLDEVWRSKLGELPDLQADRQFVARIHGGIVEAAKRLSERRLFLEGTNHILRQREFQDVLRLEQLLATLEQRSVLFEVFSRAATRAEVAVLIGNEVSVEAMTDCSVVTSSYRIAGKPGGFIGVVGPTRMRYHRAVSAVGLMAESLSQLLTRSYLE